MNGIIIITERNKVLNVWKKYFENLLNGEVNNDVERDLPVY